MNSDRNYDLSNKTTLPLCFSNSYSMVIKLFKILIKPALQNHITKNFNLELNVPAKVQTPALCNLFWNEYCFNYKQKTTVKGKE